MNGTPRKPFVVLISLVWGVCSLFIFTTPAMAQTSAVAKNPSCPVGSTLVYECGPGTSNPTCAGGFELQRDGELVYSCGHMGQPCPEQGIRLCESPEAAIELLGPPSNWQLDKRLTAVEARWSWGVAVTPAYVFTPSSNVALTELALHLNVRMVGKVYAHAEAAWAPALIDDRFLPGSTSVFLGPQIHLSQAWRIGAGYRGHLIWNETAEAEGDLMQFHLGELQVAYEFRSGFHTGFSYGFGHAEWASTRPQPGIFPAGYNRPQVPTQDSGWGAHRIGVQLGWTFN